MIALNDEHRSINHTREASYDAKLINKLSFTMRKRAKKLEFSNKITFDDLATALIYHYGFDIHGERRSSSGGRGAAATGKRASRGGEEADAEEEEEEEEEEEAERSTLRKRPRRAAPGSGSAGAVTLNWSQLGHDISRLFLCPTGMTTMLGPISKTVKVRKQMERLSNKNRRNAEDDEIEKPENILQSKNAAGSGSGSGSGAGGADDEKGEATLERILTLEKVIKRETAARDSITEGFSLLDVLIDPLDHVQTVENFFDFAFFVKDGDVLTKYDKNSGFVSAVQLEKSKAEGQEGREDKGVSVRKQQVRTWVNACVYVHVCMV